MEKSDILKVSKLVFEYILNLDDLELNQLLSGVKVNVLKSIERQTEIFVKSRSKKDEIIDKLVQGTMGFKIKMKILTEI